MPWCDALFTVMRFTVKCVVGCSECHTKQVNKYGTIQYVEVRRAEMGKAGQGEVQLFLDTSPMPF